MSETKKVAVRTKPQQGSVDTFISQALAANAPVETLERLFALHKEVNAEKARAAFTDALATFQSEAPIIEKTKKVFSKDGKLRYVFAPIDSIVEQIKKPLASNGFSYTFTVENNPDTVTVTAKLTHRLGHFETSSFTIPIDKEGYMTEPQKVAAALTFGKRYTLCNVTGITTGDEDTDATTVGKEPSPKSQKSKVIFLLRELGETAKDVPEYEEAVRRLTDTTLKDENLASIIKQLEAKVIAKKHDSSTIS
jgi:hypothetical protein